jgi:hypothetical protein
MEPASVTNRKRGRKCKRTTQPAARHFGSVWRNGPSGSFFPRIAPLRGGLGADESLRRAPCWRAGVRSGSGVASTDRVASAGRCRESEPVAVRYGFGSARLLRFVWRWFLGPAGCSQVIAPAIKLARDGSCWRMRPLASWTRLSLRRSARLGECATKCRQLHVTEGTATFTWSAMNRVMVGARFGGLRYN